MFDLMFNSVKRDIEEGTSKEDLIAMFVSRGWDWKRITDMVPAFVNDKDAQRIFDELTMVAAKANEQGFIPSVGLGGMPPVMVASVSETIMVEPLRIRQLKLMECILK